MRMSDENGAAQPKSAPVTGLDQFKLILKEYRSLSLWAAAGSVALPFVTQFIGVIPPWPDGLDVITAIFQLVALMYIYQKYFGQTRDEVTKGIERTIIILAILFMAYIALFLTFVIPHDTLDIVFTRGFMCTGDALVNDPYKDRCPWLGLDDIKNSALKVETLWTGLSIGVVRMALLAVWVSIFIALAAVLGRFLTFQINEKLDQQPTTDEK